MQSNAGEEGPYTGCSLNPARTFGPAVWNDMWKDHWVYYVGPTLGALLGTYTYQMLFALPREPRGGNHLPCPLELKSLETADRLNNKSVTGEA